MPRISVSNREGEVREIDAKVNKTLMEALRDAGFEIEAICGGCCSCATCHVFIDPAFVDRMPAMNEDEDLILSGSEHRRPDLSRLSCQIRLSDQMEGLHLTIAPAD